MNDQEFKAFIDNLSRDETNEYVLQGTTVDEIRDRRKRVCRTKEQQGYIYKYKNHTFDELLKIRQLDDEIIKKIQNSENENDYFILSDQKFESFAFEQQPLGVYTKTITKYRDVVKEMEVEVVKVKDNEEIQQNYQCPVCLENAINVIFQCGHGVCAYCKSRTKTTKCFYCRQSITNEIKLFL